MADDVQGSYRWAVDLRVRMGGGAAVTVEAKPPPRIPTEKLKSALAQSARRSQGQIHKINSWQFVDVTEHRGGGRRVARLKRGKEVRVLEEHGDRVKIMWSTWQNQVSDSVLKTDRMSDTPKIWIGWANKHSPTRVLQIVPDYWFSALPKAKHQLFF
eukprot:COSAG06_NODE_11383_length_1518_cov_1.584919_2_plen_157_part_00